MELFAALVSQNTSVTELSDTPKYFLILLALNLMIPRKDKRFPKSLITKFTWNLNPMRIWWSDLFQNSWLIYYCVTTEMVIFFYLKIYFSFVSYIFSSSSFRLHFIIIIKFSIVNCVFFLIYFGYPINFYDIRFLYIIHLFSFFLFYKYLLV